MFDTKPLIEPARRRSAAALDCNKHTIRVIIKTMETKVAKKINSGGLKSLLLDRVAQQAARARVIGIWKGHTGAMIKENRKIRKEWDKRVKKLNW